MTLAVPPVVVKATSNEFVNVPVRVMVAVIAPAPSVTDMVATAKLNMAMSRVIEIVVVLVAPPWLLTLIVIVTDAPVKAMRLDVAPEFNQPPPLMLNVETVARQKTVTVRSISEPE